MASKSKYRVIVHSTRKGWTWTQVSRNGSAGAVAPATFDKKDNARRAGQRQVDALNSGHKDAHDRLVAAAGIEGAVTGNPLPADAAVLIVDEKYVRL